MDKAIRQAQVLSDLAVVARQDVPEFAPASEEDQAAITVLLTTSPMPSHPSPWVVENVYNSLRRHLLGSRILILADGVTGAEPEAYTEFKKNAQDLGWELLSFTGHHHQNLMVREALKMVTTPLVIVGDGDWGFHKRYMDWRGIVATLLDESNHVQHIQIRQDNIGVWELDMDCFGELENLHGIYVVPTRNFQAPTHIARTDWYRNLASSFKTPQLLERGEMWNALHTTGAINEMAAYIPPGPIQRIYHLNGQHVRWPEQLGGIGDL